MRSSVPTPSVWTPDRISASRLRCVSMTPFGTSVVPLVYTVVRDGVRVRHVGRRLRCALVQRGGDRADLHAPHRVTGGSLVGAEDGPDGRDRRELGDLRDGVRATHDGARLTVGKDHPKCVARRKGDRAEPVWPPCARQRDTSGRTPASSPATRPLARGAQRRRRGMPLRAGRHPARARRTSTCRVRQSDRHGPTSSDRARSRCSISDSGASARVLTRPPQRCSASSR